MGDESYVLVDLRSEKAASKGHIKGAVSIPMADIAKYKDKFPKDKGAPVILYSDSQASEEAFALVRGWGYKNVSLLKGGAKAWTGKFLKGAPGSKIVYVKKLKEGEISIPEFKKIIAEKPADKVIIDVCESREFILAGAMAIPRPELADRLNELPKDKEIIPHCYTGINAKMAYDILIKNGFKARYLDAVVMIRPDGTCECVEK